MGTDVVMESEYFDTPPQTKLGETELSLSKYSDPITTSVPIHSRAYASHRISVVRSASTLY